jgi:SAM-dependent methyltransferase
MHDTAYEIGGLFFQLYVTGGDSILDIGSININGSLRDFCPEGSSYCGVDLSSGPGVDVVVTTNAKLPFSGGVFDIVVSTSCLEHDAMFWMTFLEMCRVLKEGGYLYLNAPSKGGYHQYPIDAWRFFPDAGIALCDWARLNNHAIELLESFITQNQNDIWNDCVMIFGKKNAERAARTVSEQYPRAINIKTWPNLGDIERRQNFW